MKFLSEISEAVLHFIFPRVCEGCGGDLPSKNSMLCLRCMEAMPVTGFEFAPNNPVEKRFYGRLPLQNATAQYHFSKDSLISKLVHQVKYRRNRELGLQLGSMMGAALKISGRFEVDYLVPVPLFPARERKRGYNQSQLLCEGMEGQLGTPTLKTVLRRLVHTGSQTHKGRLERWTNMEGKFSLTNPEKINGRHILLVDDVVTTGATLEACGIELLKAGNVTLSIACLCHALS